MFGGTDDGARRSRPPGRAKLTILVVVALVATAVVSTVTTERAAEAAAGSTVIGVIGDFGVNNSAADAVGALVNSWTPEYVATTGDNIYPLSGVTGTDRLDLTVGRLFCAHMKGSAPGPRCPSGGTSTANRFFPTVGNHDYDDGPLQNYLDYFNLPGPGTTSTRPTGSDLFYDVVMGPVHLFVIDSEAASRSTTSLNQQRAWLQEAVSASTSPWQVVALHRPPYGSSSTYGSNPAFQWPYATWGADLVLAGHAHLYERVQRDGISYVTIGLGGTGSYGFGTPVEGSVVRYNAANGAVRLDADQSSLRLRMIDVKGTTVDDHQVTPAAGGGGGGGGAVTTVAFQDGVAPTPSYTGTRDTTLFENEPNRIDGSSGEVRVDGDDPPGSGKDLAALMSWDVGAIPSGSKVLSARVVYNVTNTASVDNYQAYAVRRPWTEAGATWLLASSATPWQVAGASGAGDRDAAAIGTWQARALGPVTLDLGTAGAALVQSWVDGTAPNAGIALANPTNADGVAASSRESTTPANRPRLEVTYEAPVTTTTTTSSSTTSSTTSTSTSSTTSTTTPTTSTTTSTSTTSTTTSTTSTTTTAPPLTVPGPFATSTPRNGTRNLRPPVALGWTASSGAVSYAYCVDTVNNGICDTAWVSTGSSRSAAVSSLASRRTYYWMARATNAQGSRLANGGAWWSFSTR